MIVNFHVFLLKFLEINSLNKNSCKEVIYLVSADVLSILLYLLDSYMILNRQNKLVYVCNGKKG
jgi:hypothetical protein